MTTHPQRRTRRPAKATLGTHLATGGLAVLVAVILFQTYPQIMTVVLVIGGLAYITTTRRPRRSRLPGGHRPLAFFQQMTPTGFEHAIRDLAREDQTHVHSAEVVGGANDRGADVLVTLKDRRRILIQCKRYRERAVGSEHVQIVNGTYRHIHDCDLAVIVTTSTFTPAARDTQQMIGRGIRLVDGDQLVAWANGGRPPWQ